MTIKSSIYRGMLWCMLLISFVACQQNQPISSPEKDQPNVILILVDDQGYGDIAALGNPYIKTPNIDQLHSQSIRLTDYHVNPTCAPTRAALMTGRNANRTGVWHTINGRSLLPQTETTMADIFKANGYSTSLFGKWHLGDNYPFRPQDHGFEEVLMHGGGGIEQTMDYFDNDYFNDTYIHNGELKQYQGYCTDIWFDEAIKHIDKNKDKPFFCYLPTNTAHSPYFVDDKYSEPYQDNEDIPLPAFYGMIANIDENLGKLFNYLDKNALSENTIVIFTTDNGTAQGARVDGHRLDGFVSKGFNAGMRGIKASKYEGGHRVPLFLHWKGGKLNVGKDIDEVTAHYDILPTLIDLCGLETEDHIQFDGKSLRPLFDGDNSGFRDRIVITNSQRTEDPEPWRRTSLMQGKWRLIDGVELYDLNTDPEQREDIADQHPEKMAEFKAAYDQWWEEIKPSYEPDPLIYVGHEAENPTTLYCHDWHTDKDSPWHQRHIRTGYIDNGPWFIHVDQPGAYTIKLRRWPKEINLPLNAKADIRPAIEGTSVSASKESKVLHIQKARLKIQNFDEEISVDASQPFVEFSVELEKGRTDLQTWFTLENGETLGAYYVEVEKL